MSDAQPILKVSNIESYYGPIMAIRGVSLSLQEGKVVTVLGANGAGKTTILKTISGVLDPLKGSVEFQGKPIQRMDPDKIVRLGISHVPEGREVFPFLTVRENLAMGAFLRTNRDEVAQDLEGMALMSDRELFIATDNDFGTEGAETRFYRLRFDAAL